ncbi:MalY/PatB family protein [Gynuella sunshinyii]|uniref:cysteine-S-conjugate beta-lyase n=1 Tax=Gynuella sunshinyii YC6258 TaxID=1445510 RepID=A0A0C5VKC2_9GAMM|nr:PatB family C-S lyase [Gynuella sunshinyii]AJQ95137.1 bifunctional PLP-dependent enzyme with beta-cystathionase and maltose regulon repressor activities [Gynuella sunshinyii YC6258]
MPFDFDKPTDRSQTNTEKHNWFKEHNAIPMWVADTEFESPPQIKQALIKRAEHGIFGYTEASPKLINAVQKWLQEQYQWSIEPEWLVWLPGIVPGLNVAVRAFARNGKVAAQTPNYPPILTAPELGGAVRSDILSRWDNNRWVLDTDSLIKAVSEDDCHMLILSNPMNPCGSVMTEAEIKQLIEVCDTHNVLICSDEIHCDILMDETFRHKPVGKYEPKSITMMAASKTFNIAGLSCSFAIIPDAGIRKSFNNARKGIVPVPNLMGYLATEVAFETGKPWLTEMNRYLRANRDYAINRINQWPGIHCNTPEATFLLWLDCRQTDIADPFGFFLKHGVALSDGKAFGTPGFVRMNYGCQRSMLVAALDKMEQALCSIRKI